jgi:hypothetical protein
MFAPRKNKVNKVRDRRVAFATKILCLDTSVFFE